MQIYWLLWAVYVLVVATMATTTPLLQAGTTYSRTYDKFPGVWFYAGRFLMLLPFAIFGQMTAPLPAGLAVIGFAIGYWG